MAPALASTLCILGIVCLFVLDEERRLQGSWALWVPVSWLLLAGSRHVSVWLNMAPAVSADQYLEGSPVDRLIYSLLVAAGAVVLYARRKAVTKILRQNRLIMLFIGFCLVSVVWSDFPEVAFKRWIKSLGDYIVVLIMLTEWDRVRAIKRVFARVGFILLPLSILLIKYYPEWGRAYATHWDGTQSYIGVADTKNMLGMICMVFGFAAFWHLLCSRKEPRQKRRRIYLIYGSIVAMALWLLLISDSKTSLMCFLAAAGVISLHTFVNFARKKAVLHTLVASVFLLTCSALFLEIGGGLLQRIGRDSTLTGRTDIWRAVLAIPINPVLGTGFESFWLGDRLNQIWASSELFHINEAHNGYLEVYLNLGFVGLALVAMLMITGYRNLVRSLPGDPNAGRLRLGFFIIAVTYNLTEAAIRSTDLVWIAFLIAFITVPQKARLWPSMAKRRAQFAPSHWQAEMEMSLNLPSSGDRAANNLQQKMERVSQS